ncbi:hypothetical protein ACER0C_009735 [Sarotherodon galilaeus]
MPECWKGDIVRKSNLGYRRNNAVIILFVEHCTSSFPLSTRFDNFVFWDKLVYPLACKLNRQSVCTVVVHNSGAEDAAVWLRQTNSHGAAKRQSGKEESCLSRFLHYQKYFGYFKSDKKQSSAHCKLCRKQVWKYKKPVHAQSLTQSANSRWLGKEVWTSLFRLLPHDLALDKWQKMDDRAAVAQVV